MPVLSPCLELATIDELASGNTPEEQAWEAIMHFSDCGKCASLFDSMIDPVILAAREYRTEEADFDVVNAVAEQAKRLLQIELSSASSLKLSAASSVDDSRVGKILSDPNRTQAHDSQRKLGKFVLLAELGRGGMGAIYHARDTISDRDVALKLILTDSVIREDQRLRFLREAKAVAKVRHPHIVTLFEVDVIENTPYLVMPLLTGQTLAAKLTADGPMAAEEVARLGQQIADGLAAAHEAKLVHRDIKPANIWIEPNQGGWIQILDFGLAKPVDNSAEEISAAMVLAGTPQYMSPEQAKMSDIDHRSDLFSLGLVLYEMCTGRTLFARQSNRAILDQVRNFQCPQACELLPGIQSGLAALIAELLQHEANQRRPQTARELCRRFRELDFSPTLQTQTPQSQPKARGRRIQPLLLIAIGAVVLGIAAILAAQVIIVKDHNGKEKARIEPPEGSTTKIDKDGNLTVTLPAPKEPVPSPAPTSITPIPPAATEIKPPRPKWPDPPGGKLASLDDLKREDIDLETLALAGHGDPKSVPKELVAAVKGHSGLIHSMALHPNGYTLATGGEDTTIRLSRLVGTAIEAGQTLKYHQDKVLALAFSPDGQYLISGDLKGEVAIWDPKTWQKLDSFSNPGEGVFSLAVAPNSRSFAVGHGGENARIHDLPRSTNPAKVLRLNNTQVRSLAYTPDGKSLIAGSNGKLRKFGVFVDTSAIIAVEAKVWYQAISSHPRRDLIAVNGRGMPIDGREISKYLSGFANNRDIDLQNSLTVRDGTKAYLALKVLQHKDRVWHCQFSDDGKRLISRALDGRIHFWDWEGETELKCIHYFDPSKFAIDPATGKTKIDPETNKPMNIIQELGGFAAHPDGRHAIVGNWNGVIAIFRYSP